MNRLLVLIVEVEQPEGLSSRKLLIESMKHNVVTAYSGSEALDLLNRMRPDIVLVHRHLQTPSCSELLASMKKLHPQVPVAVMSPNAERCSIEDYRSTVWSPRGWSSSSSNSLNRSSGANRPITRAPVPSVHTRRLSIHD